MPTIIEIIGSAIIGGMVLLLLLSTRMNISQTSDSQVANSIVQSSLTSLTEILDADVKNIGYQIYDGSSFLRADSNFISFKYYNNISANTDSIIYYYDAVQKRLFRKYNNTTGPNNLLITYFNVCYYDKSGHLATINSAIKYFKIAITVQDTFQYNQGIISAYWEKTYKPLNL